MTRVARDLLFVLHLVFLFLCLADVEGIRIVPPPPPPPFGPHGDRKCKQFKNLTDLEEVPRHKYRILERCVFYHLRDKYQGPNRGPFLRPNSLSAEAPYDRNGNIRIDVRKVAAKRMNLADRFGSLEISVEGYVIMTWHDPRLTWNSARWKTSKIRIFYPGDIWMPDTRQGVMALMSTSPSRGYVTAREVFVTNAGQVNATFRFEFFNPELCEANYANFPDDTVSCCLELNSEFYAAQIRYDIPDDVTSIEVSKLQKRFTMTSLTTRLESRPEGQSINICFDAARNSPTLKIELTLPMALSAILVLISPLFRNYKLQAAVKMFSLLFQLICLLILVQRTAYVSLGQNVPAIYKFYQLTMIITMIGLIITLLVYSLAHSYRKLPPPHRLVLICQSFNRALCCGSSQSHHRAQAATHPESGTTTPNGVVATGQAASGAATAGEDWATVWLALNNLLSMITLVAYAIGLIIVFA